MNLPEDNSHINGIKSFWGYAKTKRSKFRGMNKNRVELHLKECEFRFNNSERICANNYSRYAEKKLITQLRPMINANNKETGT